MARILVVEDDEDFRALAIKILGRRGYDVAVADNGSLGVERALAEQTDLVLMDLRLPGIDGWEATRRIKAARPALPVVACSANAMPADMDEAHRAGCDAFLAKPYQVAELVAVVTRFLP
jgi:two-component system cell cycle response regulator DivK